MSLLSFLQCRSLASSSSYNLRLETLLTIHPIARVDRTDRGTLFRNEQAQGPHHLVQREDARAHESFTTSGPDRTQPESKRNNLLQWRPYIAKSGKGLLLVEYGLLSMVFFY